MHLVYSALRLKEGFLEVGPLELFIFYVNHRACLWKNFALDLNRMTMRKITLHFSLQKEKKKGKTNINKISTDIKDYSLVT